MNSTLIKDRHVVMDKHRQIIMALRVASILVSLFNVAVLAHQKLKDSVFKYLLVIAVIDAVYFFLIYLLGILTAICVSGGDSTSQCAPDVYYIFLVLFVFLSDFLTSSLALTNILLEIFLTLQRSLIIANHARGWLKDATVLKSGTVLFLVSLGCYAPMLLIKKVELAVIASTNSTTPSFDYRLVKSEFGKSKLAAGYQVVINSLRIVLVCGVLFVLNVIVTRRFRDYLKKKNDLKHIKCNRV